MSQKIDAALPRHVQDAETAQTESTPPPAPAPSPPKAASRNHIEMAPLAVSEQLAANAAGRGDEVPAGAKAAISAALTRSLANPLFTTADAQRVNEVLGQLNGDQFSAALHWMAASGLLAQFNSTVDVQDRQRFLQLAETHGLIAEAPSQPRSGPFDPPSTPGGYVNDPDLARPLRDVIHEHTVSLASGYSREHWAYLERYAAAAGRANSGAELRAMGPPRSATYPTDAIGWDDPLYTHYKNDSGRRLNLVSTHDAELAVSRRLSDLIGEARAGSVFTTAKFKIEARGVEAEWDVREHAGPSAMDRNKLTVTGAFGPVVAGVEQDFISGQRQGIAGVQLGTSSDGVRSTVKTDGTSIHEVKTGGNSAKFGLDAEGRFSAVDLKFKGFGVGFSDDGVALHTPYGSAYADPTKARFGATVKRELTVGDAKVTAEVGAGFNGLSQAGSRHALRSEGIHALPPELERSVPWSELSAESLERVTRNGWTEAEWSHALSLRAPSSR